MCLCSNISLQYILSFFISFFIQCLGVWRQGRGIWYKIDGLVQNYSISIATALLCTFEWRNNECDGVSINQRLHCLLNCWFGCRYNKTSKLHVTGHCVGISPVTGEFPAQKANKAKKSSHLMTSSWSTPLICDLRKYPYLLLHNFVINKLYAYMAQWITQYVDHI